MGLLDKLFEWFQDIRDCIVHHYGYLSPNHSKHEKIREFAATSDEIAITSDDRIHLSRPFCQQHLANIESFFKRLIATTDLTNDSGKA